MSSKRKLKAFVRYDGQGYIVPGSAILAASKPKVGHWEEIQASECCNTTTTTRPICVTYGIVVGSQAINLFYTNCDGERLGPFPLNPEASDTFCCVRDSYEIADGRDAEVTLLAEYCNR